MQYTIRNIPPQVDAELRRRARSEEKTINQVAIEALQRGTGASGEAIRYRDLRDVAGTWVEDQAFDAAIADQHQIDDQLWK